MPLDRPEFLECGNAMRTVDHRSASGGRPAATGQPGRPGRRQRGDPGGSRDAGHRAADTAPDHRRDGLAGRRHRIARHRAGAFRRPRARGPVVRQRRRRRTADGAAGRPARRRDPVRGVLDRRGPAVGGATWLPRARADRYAAAAAATLAAATPILARLPRSGGHWLAVAEAAVRGPIQIAVACDPAGSDLLRQARTLAPGGAVVVGGAVNSVGAARRPRPGGRVPTPPTCAAAGCATCR